MDITYAFDSGDESMEMNKKISLFGMIGLALTTVIGTGVWKDSLLWSNSASILSLPAVFLAWLLMFCVGLSYAESVSMFPQGGGPYSYVGGAFGRKAGSFTGILYMFSYYIIGALLGFLTALFSLAALSFPTFELLTTVNLTIVTIIWIIVFTLMSNMTSYKVVGMVTFLWSIAKIVLVVGVFAFLFISWTPATIAIPDLAGFQNAVNSTVFALLGFELMLVFADESEEPEKTVPKAIIIALPIILVLYLVVSFLASGIVGIGDVDAFSNSSIGLLIFLAASTGIPANYIFAFGAFAGAGTAYAIYGMCTKQMRILAKDGVLPSKLVGKEYGIDLPAIMTMVFVSIVGGIMVGTQDIWPQSIDAFATAGIAAVLLSAMLPAGITALILRVKMPALDRPYKTPLFQLVFPLAILLTLYLLILNFWAITWLIASFIILGIAVVLGVIMVFMQSKKQ